MSYEDGCSGDEYELIYIHDTRDGLLVREKDEDGSWEGWLPKSRIRVDGYTPSEVMKCEKGTELDVWIPDWLARASGIDENYF